MRSRPRRYQWCLIAISLLLTLGGCAHQWPLPIENRLALYAPQATDKEDDLLFRNAPLFVAHGSAKAHNRIGTPSATYDNYGREKIYVDADKPSIYTQKRSFTTEKGTYTNLIYRIHFAAIPFSLLPFNLTAGHNVGILVVVTLDVDERPVLYTTVHTCGCYKSFTPTSYLPEARYPKDWPQGIVNVYGEQLPAHLDLGDMTAPRLMVILRPEVHRVMDLRIVDGDGPPPGSGYDSLPTPLVPVTALKNIPLDGRTTSFYHEDGVLKGHVKGSVKFWETLLMSWASLDFFVGTDKAYADPAETDNPFYTSLKPWNRDESNMWNFGEFLVFWGWDL